MPLSADNLDFENVPKMWRAFELEYILSKNLII